jgi:uncharacterized phage protein gp47/JayE
MRFESVNYTELFNGVAGNLVNRAGISNTANDSKAFSIVSSFIEEGKLRTGSVNDLIRSLKLESATGIELDTIGEFVGISRLLSTRAYTRAMDTNVEFYVASGTFGTLNSGSDIPVPAGSRIYLEQKDSTSGSIIEYRTTASATLPAAGTSAFISVEAVEYGSTSNVSTLALNKHDLNFAKLKVRNNFAIANGRDRQSDSAYRFLISKAFTAGSTGNETSLRFASLTVPGVREAKILRRYNGIGTVGIFIDGFEGKTPLALVSAVQSRLPQIESAGDLVTVYSPKYVAIEMELVVQTTTLMSLEDRTRLSSNLVLALRSYFNLLKLGQGLDLDGLFANIVRSNNAIARIGRKNGENRAELINAYYSDSYGAYNLRTVTGSNVSVTEEQKVILLDTITNPIRITVERI